MAIVGYPEDGPLNSVPGRIGTTVTVLSDDAYGRGPVTRTVTSLSGVVRHGNSGGPAVDAAGAVQATVFAARASGLRRLRDSCDGREAGARLRARPGLDRSLRPLACRRTIPHEG